jgi:hypothetical protein
MTIDFNLTFKSGPDCPSPPKTTTPAPLEEAGVVVFTGVFTAAQPNADRGTS